MAGDPEPPLPSSPRRGGALREVTLLFLRLGTTAFGGPAAYIALMEEETVRRRGWISREGFLDLLGATNLIPGPNATEMAIHLGRLRAGFPGLVAAGAAFIAPAALLTGAFAWIYQRYGTLPRAAGFLEGVQAAVVAVVAQALWALARVAIKDRLLAAVAAGAVAASLLGAGEMAILAVAGAAVMAARRLAGGAAAAMLPLALPAAVAPAAAPFSLSTLFLVFLKTGSVLFGSGYVLLAYLRADLVERLGWLTEAQLLDAVAVGQLTPGPVLSTATFAGYVLGGAPGAALATLGIFLPAFVFVAISGPLVPRLRASPAAGALLDGVNAASLALMAAVTLELARAALTGPFTLAVAAASALLLFRWRVNSAWLVLGGARWGSPPHGCARDHPRCRPISLQHAPSNHPALRVVTQRGGPGSERPHLGLALDALASRAATARLSGGKHAARDRYTHGLRRRRVAPTVLRGAPPLHNRMTPRG